MGGHVVHVAVIASIEPALQMVFVFSQSLEEPAMAEPFAGAVAGADEEPEFDFLSGADEAATKLDLAQAYIDMGDDEGARDIRDRVKGEGKQET